MVLFACYGVVLACAGATGGRRLWTAIIAAHLVALVAPPLFSADVFGYLNFARLGALHGLNPYTHTAASVPLDPINQYVGWHNVSSPYGPGFTLLSYAVEPFGIPAGLWILKAIAAAASLATTALIWRTADRRGLAPAPAAALFGLNPLVLVFAVGGGHNDTLAVLLAATGVWLYLTGADRRGASALAATAAVKATAGLALPYALLAGRRSGRALAAALGALAAVAAASVLAFGWHPGAVADTLRGQQQFVAVHSLPSEVSRLLGLGRLAGGVRLAFLLTTVAVLVAAAVVARRQRDRWVEAYGWATLGLLAGTAWLLPWYGVWALLPAALSSSRRLRATTLVFSCYLVATRMPVTNGVLG